jgi:hypothetical protein
LSVQYVVATAGLDAYIVNLETKQRIVNDADVSFAMREHATGLECRINGIFSLGTRLYIDASARGFDGGQAQEQLIEGTSRQNVAARIRVGQTHLFKLTVDLLQQGLVA